jgi:hypothetical protein
LAVYQFCKILLQLAELTPQLEQIQRRSLCGFYVLVAVVQVLDLIQLPNLPVQLAVLVAAAVVAQAEWFLVLH